MLAPWACQWQKLTVWQSRVARMDVRFRPQRQKGCPRRSAHECVEVGGGAAARLQRTRLRTMHVRDGHLVAVSLHKARATFRKAATALGLSQGTTSYGSRSGRATSYLKKCGSMGRIPSRADGGPVAVPEFMFKKVLRSRPKYNWHRDMPSSQKMAGQLPQLIGTCWSSRGSLAKFA